VNVYGPNGKPQNPEYFFEVLPDTQSPEVKVLAIHVNGSSSWLEELKPTPVKRFVVVGSDKKDQNIFSQAPTLVTLNFEGGGSSVLDFRQHIRNDIRDVYPEKIKLPNGRVVGQRNDYYPNDPTFYMAIDLPSTLGTGNFDLKMSLQRIDIARSMLRFSKGKLLPTIDGKVAVGSTKYAKYTQENAGNSTTRFEGNIVPNPLDDFYLGLTTNWEIDIWGKLKNQRKGAVSNVLASLEGKNLVISSLVADIAIAYYELIALDNELEIIQQTIQRQQDALEAVKAQKDNGKANELAVQQFQSQLLNTQAREKETKQQIADQRCNKKEVAPAIECQ
jgi:hypothetical protein